MSRGKRAVSALLALLVVLSGCRADVAVLIDVSPDGSGTVDVEAVLTEVSGDVIVADLQDAGWDVQVVESGPQSRTVSASKPVVADTAWQSVLDEIVGAGVFNDVTVDVRTAFATTEQTFSMDVDADELRDRFEGRVSMALDVRVAAGGDSSPVADQIVPTAETGVARVNVMAASEDSTAVLIRTIAIALFSLFALATVLAITGIVLQRKNEQTRAGSRPASLATRVPGAAATGEHATVTKPARTRGGAVRLIVVEPLTVLYEQSPSSEILAFIRDQGGDARADAILNQHQRLLTGAIDTAEFWSSCELTGASDDLDREFVDGREVRDGAVAFLAEMQHRRIPVAAISNDAAPWSSLVRNRDGLRTVWPWLVSAEVGALTDDAAMFEVLHRESGVAYAHCLFIDSRTQTLDVARELGMKTALIDTAGVHDQATSEHAVVRSFAELHATARPTG